MIFSCCIDTYGTYNSYAILLFLAFFSGYSTICACFKKNVSGFISLSMLNGKTAC